MKLPTAGEYQAHELGSKFYLWHAQTRKQLVVISSHGGTGLYNKPFKVPSNMTIHFYAPHGYILKDPSISAAADGSLDAFDSYSSGAWCPNYELTKFQGAKHGGASETYDRIGVDMHKNARIAKQTALNAELGLENSPAAMAGIKDIVMDVITVRNRRLQKSPTLAELISIMVESGLQYKDVYCSFCRCRSDLPDELDRSWNAALQQPA